MNGYSLLVLYWMFSRLKKWLFQFTFPAAGSESGLFYTGSQGHRDMFFLLGFLSAVHKHRSSADILNITLVFHQLVCPFLPLSLFPPSLFCPTPTPPIHHVDGSLGARLMFNCIFYTELSQPKRAVFPQAWFFCLLISWKTSMKNSLFLFPQCNVLMESDVNVEP